MPKLPKEEKNHQHKMSDFRVGEKLGGEATEGYKLDGEKPMVDRVPASAILGAAKALTHGHLKYDLDPETGEVRNEIYRNNWREGMRWGRVYSAMQRHLLAWLEGEDFDIGKGGSGLLHMDHVLACAVILREYYAIFPQGDDRYTLNRADVRVVLDIDGVLADFNKGFLTEALNRGIIDDAQFTLNRFVSPNWHYQFDYMPLFNELRANHDFWLSLDPISDPADWSFQPLAYLTHRPIPSEVSEAWLWRNGFPKAPVYTTNGDKSIVAKDLVDRFGKGLIFVDDRYDNYRDLQNSGYFCYLMDARHNRKYEVGHHRITSLSEIGRRAL